MNRALSGVSAGRLVVSPRLSRLELGAVYSITFSRETSVALRGQLDVSLDVRHAVRIISPSDQPDSYGLETVVYAYHLESYDRREMISFHWNRPATPPERSYPHLHIGSIVATGSPILPDRFHKLHIPSGPLTLATVVTFAIEELGVEVLPGRDRDAMLREIADLDSNLRAW